MFFFLKKSFFVKENEEKWSKTIDFFFRLFHDIYVSFWKGFQNNLNLKSFGSKTFSKKETQNRIFLRNSKMGFPWFWKFANTHIKLKNKIIKYERLFGHQYVTQTKKITNQARTNFKNFSALQVSDFEKNNSHSWKIIQLLPKW
jgi:hypothetical protein